MINQYTGFNVYPYGDMYIYDGNTKNSTRHRVDDLNKRLDDLMKSVDETDRKIEELRKDEPPKEDVDYFLKIIDVATNIALGILAALALGCWFSDVKSIFYLITFFIVILGYFKENHLK